MAKISVNGTEYRVVETLKGRPQPTKVVAVPDSPTGEKVAVKQRGEWRFWGQKIGLVCSHITVVSRGAA